jgi:hypothetical protein
MLDAAAVLLSAGPVLPSLHTRGSTGAPFVWRVNVPAWFNVTDCVSAGQQAAKQLGGFTCARLMCGAVAVADQRKPGRRERGGGVVVWPFV